MARAHLDGDPDDWSVVARMTFVCVASDGRIALTPEGTLPSGALRRGEHPLDACLRIPLAKAGFRYQHFHPFALDGDHLYAWVEGDPYHTPPVVPRFGAPADPDERSVVDDAVADRASLPADIYYRESVRSLERAYLMSETPEGQSGFGRDADAWRAARIEVADAVGRDGTFLDVGCANGYLVECVVRWCAERGVRVEPYGVDLAPGLVDLARRRLPHWADRFWVGNAVDWVHPGGMRFDAVHTLLDCVPEGVRGRLVEHGLTSLVAPGGRLIVSHYGAPPGTRSDDMLRALGFDVGGFCPSRDRARYSAGTAWIDA